ncbi:MAG: divergent PAP2 family protein [Prevotellaceae bacterium]|jgi:acid phosphatase family membrane protein YuiD|nr:divergent PAP2 family protein [Prevotellaceae bacterium]
MDFFQEISQNDALWTAIWAWFLAQLIKMLIELWRVKRLNWTLLIASGGMPSSHAAIITAVATSIGLTYGFDSALFALAAVVSLVVMYDASGVRRQAGKHAMLINTIIENIENTGIKLDKQLKTLLGHSPIEVFAGAILGILVAVLFG